MRERRIKLWTVVPLYTAVLLRQCAVTYICTHASVTCPYVVRMNLTLGMASETFTASLLSRRRFLGIPMPSHVGSVAASS